MIVALHGFWGSPADWRPVEKLIGHEQVSTAPWLCPDLNQEYARSPVTMAEWASAWTQQIRENRAKQEKATLIGYSMGGRLAMHALLAAPDLWENVLLISAHPGLKSLKERAERILSDQRWAKKIAEEPWSSLSQSWNQQAVFDCPKRAPEALELVRSEADYDRKALSEQLLGWSLGQQEFLLPQLLESPVRMTWIAGEYDQKYLNLLESVVPKKASTQKLVVAPQAGHRVPWDNPLFLSRYLHSNNGSHP